MTERGHCAVHFVSFCSNAFIWENGDSSNLISLIKCSSFRSLYLQPQWLLAQTFCWWWVQTCMDSPTSPDEDAANKMAVNKKKRSTGWDNIYQTDLYKSNYNLLCFQIILTVERKVLAIYKTKILCSFHRLDMEESQKMAARTQRVFELFHSKANKACN